jgi:hypothetical protein
MMRFPLSTLRRSVPFWIWKGAPAPIRLINEPMELPGGITGGMLHHKYSLSTHFRLLALIALQRAQSGDQAL